MTQAITKHTEKAPIAMGKGGVQLTSMEDAFRFAQCVLQSGMAPKSFQRPEAVIVAIQHGAEVGFTPMQSLQAICVINGKPTIYGDGLMALLRSSNKLAEISETIEGEGDNMVAVCSTRRQGMENASVTRFSVADAKKAKLWGKPGPWSEYPKRMLQMRARSWNVRDNFADVLAGIHVAEEVLDYSPGGRRVERDDDAASLDELNRQIGAVVDEPDDLNEGESGWQPDQMTDAERAAILAKEGGEPQ